MEGIFPLQENVEIEEVYGKKRPNSQPPSNPSTYILKQEVEHVKKDTKKYDIKKIEWFLLEKISEYERPAMEDVIEKIGEGKYIEARNNIIKAYEDGARPISLYYSIKVSNVDIASTMKIFSFLESWEIINFEDIFFTEKKVFSDLQCADEKEEKESKDDKNKVVEGTFDIKKTLINGKCDCGEDLNKFTKSMVLKCNECYKTGKYPSNISQSDFYSISEEILKRMWSKKEEYLLLDGINKYGDNWNMVSEHVKTKSKEECAFFFLRMPIMESAFSKANFDFGLPFAAAENPIMCLINFLCSIIHPTVASAGAKAALKNIAMPQEGNIREIIKAATERAKVQIEVEEAKISRLLNVIIELATIKIQKKTVAYRELFNSVDKVCEELVTLREKLAGELKSQIEEEGEN